MSKGIRRTIGTHQQGKEPLLTGDIRAMLSACDRTNVAGVRDAAMLLMGFAGGFRRSELVGLDVGDIRELPGRLIVLLRRTKTDQEGAGRELALPALKETNADVCPVRAYRTWRSYHLGATGPLFVSVDRYGNLRDTRLSGYDVARMIKRLALAAGLDPEQYAAHSLRSGLATAGAIAGATERHIAEQTGHKNDTMVRRYIRDAERLTKDNVVNTIWERDGR